MIRSITGTILSVEPLGVVVDVNGWGVLVLIASPERYTEGQIITLLTYLAVKQDGIDLYGFNDAGERSLFELFLSVSGVGPKTALSLLKRAPLDGLRSAIATRDVQYLTRVAGLGKKSAEKIIVEIAEKIGGATTSTGDDAEVFDTLVALGYTEREARSALAGIEKSVSGKEARLKAALSAGPH